MALILYNTPFIPLLPGWAAQRTRHRVAVHPLPSGVLDADNLHHVFEKHTGFLTSL